MRTATYVQQGERIPHTAASAISAGSPVKIANNYYGIADRDIPSGETGTLTVIGVYSFTAAGQIAKGAPVFLSDGKVTATPAAGTGIGIALDAAAEEGDEIAVKINVAQTVASVASPDDAAPVTTSITDANAKTAITALATSINAIIDKLEAAGVFTPAAED